MLFNNFQLLSSCAGVFLAVWVMFVCVGVFLALENVGIQGKECSKSMIIRGAFLNIIKFTGKADGFYKESKAKGLP